MKLARAAAAFYWIGPVLAHDAITTPFTWTHEISRIVYRRCAGCHQERGAAPMSLVTYDQARPWAKAIQEEVLARRMPPWGAVKGFGDFQNDASLSEEEILRIASWVEGGAPQGEIGSLPPLPRLQKLARKQGQSNSKQAIYRSTSKLAAALVLKNIQPLADAASVQITAEKPDGSIAPLLWLRGYQVRWGQVFVFRAPIHLPQGTRIVIDPPLPVRLQP